MRSGVPSTCRTSPLDIPFFSLETDSCVMRLPCWTSSLYTQAETESARTAKSGAMVRMESEAKQRRHYNSRDERSSRIEGHGPQGHAAAAEGAGPLPAQS